MYEGAQVNHHLEEEDPVDEYLINHVRENGHHEDENENHYDNQENNNAEDDA